MNIEEYAKSRLDKIYGKDPIDQLEVVTESLSDFINAETHVHPDKFIQGYEKYLKKYYSPDPLRNKVEVQLMLIIDKYKDQPDSIHGKLLAHILSDYFLNSIVDARAIDSNGLIRFNRESKNEEGDIEGYVQKIKMEFMESTNPISHTIKSPIQDTQQIKDYHGEDAVLDVWSFELTVEVIRNALASIKHIADKRDEIELYIEGKIQESSALMTQTILQVCNIIAVKTKRGAGNFVVVSPKIATLLQMMAPEVITFTPPKAADVFPVIGKLNATTKIFRDAYATDDYILVGYNGTTTGDAGIQVVLEDFYEDDALKYRIHDDIHHPEYYYEYIPFKLKDLPV